MSHGRFSPRRFAAVCAAIGAVVCTAAAAVVLMSSPTPQGSTSDIHWAAGSVSGTGTDIHW